MVLRSKFPVASLGLTHSILWTGCALLSTGFGLCAESTRMGQLESCRAIRMRAPDCQRSVPPHRLTLSEMVVGGHELCHAPHKTLQTSMGCVPGLKWQLWSCSLEESPAICHLYRPRPKKVVHQLDLQSRCENGTSVRLFVTTTVGRLSRVIWLLHHAASNIQEHAQSGSLPKPVGLHPVCFPVLFRKLYETAGWDFTGLQRFLKRKIIRRWAIMRHAG
ncbi:hypothetical protein CSKR_108430 [Clonorchis sinensis]|uniref:Uncharacterized protein n=1 Tax=Clonorchis sinensis TaxID=79923 RepID=A0A419PVF5_CLOSI|nr:hypothetical protein CSKR_108430 [Clonorchis sinensis]